MLRLGIDLGGTKIAVAVLNELHEVVYQHRLPTPQGDYQATLLQIASLVHQAEAAVGEQCTVGVGTPGSPSAVDGSMKNCNSTCLNLQPLQKDLQALLEREIRLANDANCFALSEAVDGAAAAADVVFGVILGTGVGGGIVVNKGLLQGLNHIAGEWGHNPMPLTNIDKALTGRPCYCGRVDCVETFLSGPGLSLSYKRLGGKDKTAQAIVAEVETGDKIAIEAMRHYMQYLAAALSQVMNILDPDIIVLGGGLSNIAALYKEVPQLWRKSVFSDQINTQLVPPKYGDASGVRGAAWLWAADNK